MSTSCWFVMIPLPNLLQLYSLLCIKLFFPNPWLGNFPSAFSRFLEWWKYPNLIIQLRGNIEYCNLCLICMKLCFGRHHPERPSTLGHCYTLVSKEKKKKKGIGGLSTSNIAFCALLKDGKKRKRYKIQLSTLGHKTRLSIFSIICHLFQPGQSRSHEPRLLKPSLPENALLQLSLPHCIPGWPNQLCSERLDRTTGYELHSKTYKPGQRCEYLRPIPHYRHRRSPDECTSNLQTRAMISEDADLR